MVRQVEVSSDWFGDMFAVSSVLPVSSVNTIIDFNRSIGSRNFVNIVNERASFASCAWAFETTRLIVRFEYASHQKVTHVFIAFE